MVSLTQIRSSNAYVVETEGSQSNAPDVAVFIGGTAGIGKATLTALVNCKAPTRIYIIGRDAAKHAAFLDQLRKRNRAEIIWLEGQITLLAEVKRLCKEIMTREEHVSLLFMSAGYMPFAGRDETTEGLDKAMALRYWSRMLFITQLLPLLRTTPPSGSSYKSRVISVLAAGYESANIPLDDLGLKMPGNYSVSNMIGTDATMTTLTLSRLARERENEAITFIHHNPGPVKTDILMHGWAEGSWGPTLLTVAKPFMAMVARSAEEAGERLLYMITSAQYGGSGVEAKAGLTVSKTEKGDVFLVGKDQECIYQEKVLAELSGKKAHETIQQKTEEVLKPYW